MNNIKMTLPIRIRMRYETTTMQQLELFQIPETQKLKWYRISHIENSTNISAYYNRNSIGNEKLKRTEQNITTCTITSAYDNEQYREIAAWHAPYLEFPRTELHNTIRYVTVLNVFIVSR